MISFQRIASYVGAEPFRPFRITTASGRTFEIRHPESVQVGRSVMAIYTPPEGSPDGPERWEKLAYMLIESIAPLSHAGH